MSEASTTPDLMELLRLTFEAAKRRDLEALMAFFAPDALLDTTRTVGVARPASPATFGSARDGFGYGWTA